MSRSLILSVALIVVAFFGLANATYLAQMASAGAAPVCDFTVLNGCEEVAQSEYSKIYGIPLSYLGVIFYLALLAFSLASVVLRGDRRVTRALAIVAGLGFVMSLYFTYLQYVVIQAQCAYCMVSALLASLAFVIALFLARFTRKGVQASE